MLNEILSENNLNRAKEDLLTKKDSCGIDGMKISELENYLALNSDSFFESIRNGSYTPGIVQEVDILNKRGKTRTISKLITLDRFVLRAIYQVMQEQFSSTFSMSSYAYQDNKGVLDAAKAAREFLLAGLTYSVEIDIDSFFDNISHALLLQILNDLVPDDMLLKIIGNFLRCKVERDFKITSKQKGVIQGSPLSPLLSNLFLNGFDLYMEQNGYSFIRFGDDIKIFTESYESGLETFTTAVEYLETQLNLTINKSKSGVFEAYGRIFLGYRFIKTESGIEIKQFRREQKTKFGSWQTTAVQRIDANYHLIGDGILTRSDYSLLFENEEKKMHIPIEVTESLNIHSKITTSSDFFKFANKNRLKIGFFDEYGNYIGSFIPVYNSGNDTLIKQVVHYENQSKRLEIAKRIIMAAMHNIRSNLEYYEKKLNDETLHLSVDKMDECIIEMNEAVTVKQLMLIEARAREIYFSCYNIILDDDDFTFTKRSRQPPKDAINALISFGNMVLYQRIAKEIYKTCLDIRISYLHSASNGRENLNLDIAEIFKPITIDRVIFTLINKRMINETIHFETSENNGIYLNKEGKKLFLQEIGYKLYQRISVDGEFITYESLIRSEINKLARHINKGEKYKPYKYR